MAVSENIFFQLPQGKKKVEIDKYCFFFFKSNNEFRIWRKMLIGWGKTETKKKKIDMYMCISCGKLVGRNKLEANKQYYCVQ